MQVRYEHEKLGMMCQDVVNAHAGKVLKASVKNIHERHKLDYNLQSNKVISLEGIMGYS